MSSKSLPSVPRVADSGLYDYLTRMHDVVASLHLSAQPPNLPSNLTLTPISGGVVVQFTRSNGVSFTLYAGSSPDRSQSTPIPIGTASRYTDNVGQPGVSRYYWVEALNQSGISSGVVGPSHTVTLAIGTASSPIPAIRPSQTVVFDTTLDRYRPTTAITDPDLPGLPAPSA